MKDSLNNLENEKVNEAIVLYQLIDSETAKKVLDELSIVHKILTLEQHLLKWRHNVLYCI